MKDREKLLIDYVEKIKKFKCNNILIYGVGPGSRSMFSVLKEFGITADGYIVTNAEHNFTNYEGVPVFQADKAPFERKDTLVLIGTKKVYHDEIISHARDLGYVNILPQPDDSIFIPEIEYKRRSLAAIEITTKVGCSVDCRYCPQDVFLKRYFEKDKNRKSLLSVEDYKKCIDNLPGDAVITFSGFVEPYLNPKCSELIRITHEHGNPISINTTLVGMTEKDFYELNDIPLEYFGLHLPDRDGFANIPITEEYLKVLDLILDAKNKDGKPLISGANCQSKPPEEIISFINNRVSYNNIHLIDRAGNIKKEEVAEHIYHKGKIYCPKSPALKRNILMPDGTLVLCCMDFGMEHEIGNLLENTYDEIRKSEKFLGLRRRLMTDDGDVICRKCSVAEKLED